MDAANTEQNTRPLPPELEANKWKPGQSGNPSGRPKKKPITEAFERAMEADPTLADRIAASVIQQITGGSKSAGALLKELTSRVEGNVPDKLEHSGLEGGPLEVTIRFVTPNGA